MRWYLTICVGLFLVSVVGAQEEVGWHWTLPGELYKVLSRVERAQFDKARKSFEQANSATVDSPATARQFVAAANEWKKFRTIYGDSLGQEVFAYSIMMEGLALHRGKRRHEAAKVYTEVLDYFPDTVWLAVPCLYHRALCHFDNDDTTKGVKDLETLVENSAYAEHVLAGGAYRLIAEDRWNNGEFPDALRYWRRCVETFNETNPEEAEAARDRLVDWQFFQQDLAGVERHFTDGVKKDDLAGRTRCYEKMLYWGLHALGHRWRHDYYDRFHKAETSEKMRSEHRAALTEWFLKKEMEFAQADRMWAFLLQVYAFDTTEEQLLKMVDYVRKTQVEPQVRTERALWLVKQYRNRNWYRRAFGLLDLIPDDVQRQWARYGLHVGLSEVDEALAVLAALEALNDEAITRKVKWTRAEYFMQLGRWDDAVAEFISIAEPPETLWRIVKCYRAANKKQLGYATLIEIASIFPDHAARANLARADYHRADGDHKKAVGLYRQLLNHPEWKKQRESSVAHQRLEEYKLKTSGGNAVSLENLRK